MRAADDGEAAGRVVVDVDGLSQFRNGDWGDTFGIRFEVPDRVIGFAERPDRLDGREEDGVGRDGDGEGLVVDGVGRDGDGEGRDVDGIGRDGDGEGLGEGDGEGLGEGEGEGDSDGEQGCFW